jgi:hypothetical protein
MSVSYDCIHFRFFLTYLCTCLFLFPRVQSMQMHDLAKCDWSLFIAWKWMQSTNANSNLQWFTLEFISNSYYFRKIYFLRITSLHPKFYIPIFLWDVESSPNYTEKLIFAGIGTITLLFYWAMVSHALVQWSNNLTNFLPQAVLVHSFRNFKML